MDVTTGNIDVKIPHVLFSDIDGTLVHHPEDFLEYADIVAENRDANSATIRYKLSGEERECVTLGSLTSGRFYISKTTLELISQLRQLGVCFVLITGARTSTYISRRPFLPEADFEFFENGGRKLEAGVLDPTWTDRMSAATGPIADRVNILPSLPSPEERSGTLWELYRLLKADGWDLDSRNYTTNFRVMVGGRKTAADFENSVEPMLQSRGLATSFNLGKADIYPLGSGKANAARHVLELKGWSAQQAVAMFDDDNDLELGALCGRSFLPGVTHPNVLKALPKYPSWKLSKQRGFLGTEWALREIITLRQGSSDTQIAATSAGKSTPAD